MEAKSRELLNYQKDDGKAPFDEWMKGLSDGKGRAVIRVRINRLAMGNFGDCRPVGEGTRSLSRRRDYNA